MLKWDASRKNSPTPNGGAKSRADCFPFRTESQGGLWVCHQRHFMWAEPDPATGPSVSGCPIYQTSSTSRRAGQKIKATITREPEHPTAKAQALELSVRQAGMRAATAPTFFSSGHGGNRRGLPALVRPGESPRFLSRRRLRYAAYSGSPRNFLVVTSSWTFSSFVDRRADFRFGRSAFFVKYECCTSKLSARPPHAQR